MEGVVVSENLNIRASRGVGGKYASELRAEDRPGQGRRARRAFALRSEPNAARGDPRPKIAARAGEERAEPILFGRASSECRDGAEIAVAVRRAMASIDPAYLEALVRRWARPRHNLREASVNREVALDVQRELEGHGYTVTVHGASRNLLAARPHVRGGPPCLLLGAHYDSVPDCPGADDNASALAAVVACAEATGRFASEATVCYAAFNCEEDGMLGSRELVGWLRDAGELRVREAHVFEMVGYCSHEAGSQRVPSELPIALRDRGDFLGLVANERSIPVLRRVLARANAALPGFPVVGLEVASGLENALPVLSRSDHVSFWQAAIPAVMWTDTAEFRNPHYHQRSDTPDTLDYEFLAQVTRVAVAVAAGSP